mgnify:CR=1 FL=1
MQNFWPACVYYKDGISGRLTGIVLSDTSLAPHVLKATLTRRLLPDTAFAWPGSNRILSSPFVLTL